MIFLTVGTQFPFDRLVKAVDDLVGEGVLAEEIFAQVGDGTYQPQHFQAVGALDKKAFDGYFRDASAIISHAGMGTITMALDHGKSLLVMPRRKKFQEVVNDHQVGLADRFARLGHLLVARDQTELRDRVRQLGSFVPKPRQADPEAVTQRVLRFLNRWETSGGRSPNGFVS